MTGLATKLMLGSKWYPIASLWFEKWKLYVKFNDVSDDKVGSC